MRPTNARATLTVMMTCSTGRAAAQLSPLSAGESGRRERVHSSQRASLPATSRVAVEVSFAPRRRRSGAGASRDAGPRLQCTLLGTDPVKERTATSSEGKQRIVILGGGLGGLYTAIRLDMLVWRGAKPEIIMIDQEDRFVFKPLLYELVTGEMALAEVAPTFAELVQGTSIKFMKSKVKVVEPGDVMGSPEEQPGQRAGSVGGGAVLLEDGTNVPYDWLICALGAKARAAKVPGARECAIPFITLEHAERTKEAVSRAVAARGGRVRATVVGGGYSGVELAATLRSRLGNGAVIRLVIPRDDILDGAPAGQQAAARAALARSSVQILSNRRVESMSRDESQPLGSSPVSVTLAGGEVVESDFVLWAAGQEPVGVPSLQEPEMDIPVLATGKTLIEDSLRVRRHERIFAIGDGAARLGSVELPATAQVAFQQADYVAWNVWASINGKPLLPFRYQHLGSMMSLGGNDASVAFPIGNDVTVNGPLAALLRKAAYAYRMPTDLQRIRVAAGLLVKPLIDLISTRGAGL